jgi:hypothetical protein
VTPAKRRSSGANPPKKANPVAPTSRTTPKGTPKGRVPVAAADSRSARRAKTSDDRARTADDKGRSGGAKAETPVVVDADGVPVAKPRYGAGALILAFLAGQLLSTAAYVVVQSVSNYDFAIPAGVGAAVGQASAQVSTGHALAISVPPPLWVTALMQLPLWLGIGLIPVWFAVNRGKGVVADLGLRMKAIDVPIGLAIGVASQLVMVPVLYWLLFKVIGVKDVSAAARSLTDRATDPLSIVLVFVVVGLRGGGDRGPDRRGDLLPWLRPADLRPPHPAALGDPRLGHVLRRLPHAGAAVPGPARVRSDPRRPGLAVRSARPGHLGPRGVQRRHRGDARLPSRLRRCTLRPMWIP